MFLSAIPNSWIYGCLVSYLEGRESTEVLVAAVTLTLVIAAAVAKSTANMVLSMGVAATMMPLVLVLASLPICGALLCLLDKAPMPSAEDRAKRSVR